MTNHLEPITPREQLAVYRTDLANERTVLAYARTALTLFVVGVTFLKFFDGVWFIAVGWVFLPVSVALGFFGLDRYRRMCIMIRHTRRGHHPPRHHL